MNQENAALLRQAQQAIRQGERQQARHLLQQALRQDQGNYTAWLLMASVTQDPRTSLAYVQQAAQLNPTSTTVQKALAWAENRLQTAMPSPTTRTNIQEKDTKAQQEETKDVHNARAWWFFSVPSLSARQRNGWLWGGFGFVTIVTVCILAMMFWPKGNTSNGAAFANTSPYTTGTPVTQLSAVFPIGSEEDEEETAVLPATPVPSLTPTQAPHIAAKNINQSKDNTERQPRATWTLTPTPTPTPTPTHTPMPTFVAPQTQSGPVNRPFGVGSSERWVDVNLTKQTLVAYEGDTPVLTTLISSGTWQHPTVTGQFRIYLAYKSQTMDGRRLGYDYYLEDVPYVMYFYEDYALHGTFWHNNFGTPMSHGCVNMKTSDAGWLYDWASIGTLVNVHY